jgi:hypothetical protein
MSTRVITDAEWQARARRLGRAWLRRGCTTPDEVERIINGRHEFGMRARLLRISSDLWRDPLALHWRPLWWRRRRERWGERMSRA